MYGDLSCCASLFPYKLPHIPDSSDYLLRKDQVVRFGLAFFFPQGKKGYYFYECYERQSTHLYSKPFQSKLSLLFG
jgi:hypothetical protein